MAHEPPSQVTKLLQGWRAGDREASDALMPLVYEELRRLAHNQLRNERPGHTLQSTALVHEAYFRLVGQDLPEWEGRAHFFAIAAQLMRQILVDYARRHRASKRGSGVCMLTLDDAVVNNSSGWGIAGGDGAVAYCASKGGVVLLTKAMAIDHGRQGIRVNCICPGDVDTPMLPEDARLRGLKWEDYLAGCANRPLGRIGTTDEIAKAALFLASDDSSFMTGASLVVDGGGTAD